MKSILKKALFLSAVLCACFAVSARALEIPGNVPSWKDTDKEVLAKLLRHGELVAVDSVGKNIDMVSIGMLANVPPEKLWRVVTDFEGYADLMPESVKTTIMKKKGNMMHVRFVVSVLKFSVIDINTKYTLKYVLDAPRRADISWVEGDVKNVEGYWELYPVDGGRKTVAIYAITSDLGSANPLVGRTLSEQPATVMAINLSSAIIFTEKVLEAAEGRKRPAAKKGAEPIWKAMGEAALYRLLAGGRVGFVSRIGKQQIATAGVLVRKKRNRVWNTLTNFKGYPARIKQITRADVLEKTEKFARVKMRTEVLSLGPIKIASEGETKYNFDKPSGMWSEAMIPRVKEEKKRDDLFNRWELVELAGGVETGLFNEAVSDLREMGMIARVMLKRIPAIQISVDLSQAMILANEIQKWAESK